MKRVVVVGGGIAGLAAAHRLRQCVPHLNIGLVEGEARLGGKIVTERVGDFVIEGGPDSFLASKPRGLGLCRELGLEDRLRPTNPQLRRTYVMRRGRLHRLPEGFSGLIPSRLGPIANTALLSPAGKLRLGLEFFVPARPGDTDESLAAFVRRRFGREAYERLIEPLLSGIYAGDAEQLSLAATFPQLRQAEREHGSLLRGMLAAGRGGAAPNGNGGSRAAFLTPAGGLAEMVEALKARLASVNLLLGRRVVTVDTAPPGYRLGLEGGQSLLAEAVILATPAYITADLLKPIDMQAASALRSIPHVSTATISMAYRLVDVPRPLDGYGYVIPRAENRPVLACTWTSSKFAQRAPEGYALLRAFVGRAGQQEILERSDDALLEAVQDELRATLGIAAAPQMHRIFRWPDAMPQYTLGHPARLASLRERLAGLPGLFVAGNAYRGVGLPDCIASGEQAAESVLNFVGAGPGAAASTLPCAA